ncbi:CysS/YqeB C-terminal domain-containing protein [Micromonospora purpureochromogenes]|uniref:CysS/YqeB C-terminal domain-containing protein n=1 Tax=Micromonospora purpureochromogenes TaxID=47872 RepID=UPI004032E3BE
MHDHRPDREPDVLGCQRRRHRHLAQDLIDGIPRLLTNSQGRPPAARQRLRLIAAAHPRPVVRPEPDESSIAPRVARLGVVVRDSDGRRYWRLSRLPLRPEETGHGR